MLNHVLVPLDGSQLAEAALEHALAVLSPQGKLTLLSVIDPPPLTAHGFYPAFPVYPPDSPSTYPYNTGELISQAVGYLDEVAEKVKASNDLHIAVEAEAGDPATVIIKTAERLKVDAIVMSTHGRSGISRWLFGSVTSKVLNAAPCPVFVIPSKGRHQQEPQPHAESAV